MIKQVFLRIHHIRSVRTLRSQWIVQQVRYSLLRFLTAMLQLWQELSSLFRCRIYSKMEMEIGLLVDVLRRIQWRTTQMMAQRDSKKTTTTIAILKTNWISLQEGTIITSTIIIPINLLASTITAAALVPQIIKYLRILLQAIAAADASPANCKVVGIICKVI